MSLSPNMKTLGDVASDPSSGIAVEDTTLPAAHYAIRQRYNFPQMFSTPEASKNLPRPFAKNQGRRGQAYYAANYGGGPRHTPTQVKFVSGLQKLAGFSGLGLALGQNDSTVVADVPYWRKPGYWLGVTVVLGSTVASGYHGYKRGGRSVGGALGWGLLGFIFPIITPAVALAQGYGKRRR